MCVILLCLFPSSARVYLEAHLSPRALVCLEPPRPQGPLALALQGLEQGRLDNKPRYVTC